MPNTNFQTIHQMGQAINEVVRQATGRDAVQNIDMDHVTVAQTRYFEDATASGSMVSFTDSVGGMPLEKCVVQIEPVQDLHGFDRPWAGGSGKNILPFTVDEIKAVNTRGTWSGNVYTMSGVTYTLLLDNDNNIIGVHAVGTANTGIYSRLDSPFFTPADGTYILSGCPSGGAAARYHLRLGTTISDTFIGTDIGSGFEFTASGNMYRVRIGVQEGTSVDGIFYPMVRKSTDPATYEPYSNICPITGWTGANIHVSPTDDAQDGTTYSITFPAEAGTVYGGNLEVIKGVLTVTDGHIASYNGEALPGTWISDRDVYAEGTSPTTGAEVVYELDNPITYQTTPQEILTLEGQNNIWADTGDIEVTYKVLGGLY